MRGNSSFLTQKGFLDGFTVKGDGHEVETAPSEPGSDVTDSATLDEATEGKKAANIKGGENKEGGPGTTMSDDLAAVEAGAERDITQGYVADSQSLPGPGDRIKKGYEIYNEMVDKGLVVDPGSFNKYDIDGSFDTIEKSADAQFSVGSDESRWMNRSVVKEVDDGMIVTKMKNPLAEDVRQRRFSMEGGDVKVTPGETPAGRTYRQKKEAVQGAYNRAKDYLGPKVRSAAGKVAEGGKAVGRYAAAHPYRLGGGALGAAGLIGGGAYALSRREEKGFENLVEKGRSGGSVETMSPSVYSAKKKAEESGRWLGEGESKRVPGYKTRQVMGRQFGKITPSRLEAAAALLKKHKLGAAMVGGGAIGGGIAGHLTLSGKKKD